MGGDMVTHNVGTEAIYARQLGIHFAVVNSISNPAEGVRPFTIQEELASGLAITKSVVPVVLEAIVAISKKKPDCGIICTGERY
jgi:purine nucleoside phosphorylase